MMDSAFNAKLAAQNDSTSKKRRQRRLRTGENSLVQVDTSILVEFNL